MVRERFQIQKLKTTTVILVAENRHSYLPHACNLRSVTMHYRSINRLRFGPVSADCEVDNTLSCEHPQQPEA
jgi:hypothetical protein